MREVLSDFLSVEASQKENFYVLSGDHGYALFDKIKKVAPTKFLNLGVTEQAIIGCAAGLAKTGKKVFVYGLACFMPMRVLEFIKLSICFEGLPVVILGDGAGVVYTTLGVSHQCAEDISCLKPLPIKIFSPADDFEMALCLQEASQANMPCYLRIGKSDRPIVHINSDFKLAPAIPILIKSKETAIFATGSMVSTGVEISKNLGFSVYSCPILSFYNKNDLVAELKKYKNIITLEEHSVSGGLGSSLADLILENELSTRLIKFGITDYFTKGVGSYESVIKSHHLDVDSILENLSTRRL